MSATFAELKSGRALTTPVGYPFGATMACLRGVGAGRATGVGAVTTSTGRGAAGGAAVAERCPTAMPARTKNATVTTAHKPAAIEMNDTTPERSAGMGEVVSGVVLAVSTDAMRTHLPPRVKTRCTLARVSMDPLKVSAACPGCGQVLMVPSGDLRTAVACPRCATEHVVATLIPPSTPLEAVAVRPFVATPAPRAVAQLAAVPVATPEPGSAKPLWQRAEPVASSVALVPAQHVGGGQLVFGGTQAAKPVAPSPTPAAPPPPTVYTPRTPRAAAQALTVGARGVARVGSFGARLLGLADRTDASLYGRRGGLVALAAAAATVSPWIDQALGDNLLVTTVFTFAFVGLVGLLLFARVGSLRDEDGSWSGSIVARRLGQWLGEMRDAIGSPDSADRGRTTGGLLAAVGCFILAARNVPLLAALIAEELFDGRFAAAERVADSMLVAGLIPLGLGGFLWVLGWRALRSRASAHGVDDERRLDPRVVAQLDAIIDCTDKAQVANLAGQGGEGLVPELLGAMAAWHPRGCYYEDDYQASLHRHLRRHMAWATPVREQRIGKRAEGTAGVADLIVAGSVLLELKRGLTTSTAQKAVGQIRMYLRAWDRGPVFLVVCDADRTSANRFLGQEIAELSREAPVRLILAGGSRN